MRWLLPRIFGFIQSVVTQSGASEATVDAALALLAEITYNRASRLGFDIGSAHGVLLFAQAMQSIAATSDKILSMQDSTKGAHERRLAALLSPPGGWLQDACACIEPAWSWKCLP